MMDRLDIETPFAAVRPEMKPFSDLASFELEVHSFAESRTACLLIQPKTCRKPIGLSLSPRTASMIVSALV
jgi:hypothetical protein